MSSKEQPGEGITVVVRGQTPSKAFGSGRGGGSRFAAGQSGAALILVLLIITLLLVVVMESLEAMQVEVAGASYFRDSLQAEALARSGVNLARALLAKDLQENDVDHSGERWARLPKPEALPVSLPPGGTLTGQVSDEAGKFPINFLVDDKGGLRSAYQQVLETLLCNPPFQMEVEDARTLVFAIKDWLDQDDEPTGEGGAETDYYESLKVPYGCRNGPLRSLAELELVRGIDAPLYLGKEGAPGLRDLLTIYSDGKININTARPAILRALVSPDVPEETAEKWAAALVAYRQDPMHWDFLGESNWYRNRMPGFNDINIAAELITTKSAHFSVEMMARYGLARRSIYASLERRKSAEGKQSRVKVSVCFWQVF